jgi:circadian clock protein KaiC
METAAGNGSNGPVEKILTGIAGFDEISKGGIPKGRSTLIAGTSGSAKTIFAAQFLADGISKFDEAGVFVTFEESAQDITRNMMGFGWKIDDWVANKKWAFVDNSPEPAVVHIESGDFDLGALMARIEHAVKKVNAKRVALDSLGAIFSQFTDSSRVRSELFRIAVSLRKLGVTTLMTAERTQEFGEIARFGVEEFVADNVIILRNVLDGESRRRTLEVLKFRGTDHQKGQWPFTILSEEGIVAIPLSAMKLTQKSSNVRIPSGGGELDKMCGSGFFRDSIILLSGATGTGKTLTVTHFMNGGVHNNERCLLFAFEESHQQLNRNAIGWGIDFPAMEREGKLRIVCIYPETAGLEDHLLRMRKEIEEFKPDRIAVDSLSALERVSTWKGFREFIIGLTSHIKHKDIAGMFTSTTPSLMGGTSVTETHISTLTDNIILLRYVELYGEMHRGITVLKMRGSAHDKDIREFSIDDKGMHIGKPFVNVTGILSNQLTHRPIKEVERLENLFQGEVKGDPHK